MKYLFDTYYIKIPCLKSRINFEHDLISIDEDKLLQSNTKAKPSDNNY